MPLWLTVCVHKSHIPLPICLRPKLSRALLHPLLALPHRLRRRPIKQILHSSLDTLAILIRILIHQLVKRPENRAHRRDMLLGKLLHQPRRRQPRRNHRRADAIDRDIVRRGPGRQRARQPDQRVLCGRVLRDGGECVQPCRGGRDDDLAAGDGVQRGVVREQLRAVVDAVQVDVESGHVWFLGRAGGGVRDGVEDVVAVVDAGV